MNAETETKITSLCPYDIIVKKISNNKIDLKLLRNLALVYITNFKIKRQSTTYCTLEYTNTSIDFIENRILKNEEIKELISKIKKEVIINIKLKISNNYKQKIIEEIVKKIELEIYGEISDRMKEYIIKKYSTQIRKKLIKLDTIKVELLKQL